MSIHPIIPHILYHIRPPHHPDLITESGKWQENFFATLKMSASDTPTIFFIFICHFATLPLFRFALSFSFPHPHYPDTIYIFYNLPLCHFFVSPFHSHFHLSVHPHLLYIIYFFNSKYKNNNKEIRINAHLDTSNNESY